jgi:hypothetical protein
VVAVLVVIGIGIMLSRSSGTDTPAVGTTATTTQQSPPSSLPPALDDALSELESAVNG